MSEVIAGERTGLLIIRTWIEEGSTSPLRAHVRLSTDLSEGIERTVTLADVDEVCAVVKKWLTDVLSAVDEK